MSCTEHLPVMAKNGKPWRVFGRDGDERAPQTLEALPEFPNFFFSGYLCKRCNLVYWVEHSASGNNA